MGDTREQLMARKILIPGPQLAGRCWYIDPKDEIRETQRQNEALNQQFLDRMCALRAGGWRKYRRLLIDREFRTREVSVYVPGWLAAILGSFGLDKRRPKNLWGGK